MKTWVLVEHVVSGRVSLAEYDHRQGEFRVDGRSARLADYWAVLELSMSTSMQKKDVPHTRCGRRMQLRM
jgi:hypothetical protein